MPNPTRGSWRACPLQQPRVSAAIGAHTRGGRRATNIVLIFHDFATRLQLILLNFAAVMANRLSIFCTWMATCMMLLSTIVMHHHHYERVCVAFELCQHGGDTGAEPEESHSHQESDRGSCRVHQLHKFIINTSVAKSIRHHITDGSHFVAAALPGAPVFCAPVSVTVADWQHTASTLRLRALTALKRRGPPVF